MEDSEVITSISTLSIPENSLEITSTEAEPLGANNLYVAESIEVVSTEESIIWLDEDEISEELPPNDDVIPINDVPFDLSTTNRPVVFPCTSDYPESPSMSHSNDKDDDFCIVFEKKAPPSEVQILENYISPNTQTKKKPRISAIVRNPRPSDQSEYQNPSLQEVLTEQVNSTLDDSIYIVDAVSRVINSTPSVNQSNILNSLRKSALDSAEKKKRKIECGICFDGPEDIETSGRNVVSTVCGHIFCNDCIKVSIKSFKRCPQCRKKLTMKQFHVLYL